MRVLKYQVELSDRTTVLPLGPRDRVVHVAVQHGTITLWAEVFDRRCAAESPSSEPVVEDYRRCFGVFGTGHEVRPNSLHVGTVMMDMFVWHIYELK